MSRLWDHMCRADVEQAARLLDATMPDWFTRIDLDTLNLRDLHCCVLGQVYAPRHWWQHLRIDTGYGIGLRRLEANRRHVNGCVFASNTYREYWITAILTRLATLELPPALDAVDPVEREARSDDHRLSTRA